MYNDFTVDFTREIYEDLSEKVVNEDVLKDRGIEDVILNVFRKSKKVYLLGYRKDVLSTQEIFEIDMMDHLYKLNFHKLAELDKNEFLFKESAVDLQSIKFYTLTLFLGINPNAIQKEQRANVIKYTRFEQPVWSNGMTNIEADCPFWSFLDSVGEVQPSDIGNTSELSTLILPVKLYVPILVNNSYYLINGIKYYNGFYVHRKEQHRGKGDIKIEHSDGKYSFLSVETLKLKVFKDYYNVFDFLNGMITKPQESFPEHFDTETDKPISHFGKVILEEYKNYLKLKQSRVEDIDISDKIDIRPHEVYNVLCSIGESILHDDGKELEGSDLFQMDLHKDLYTKLNSELNGTHGTLKTMSIKGNEPDVDGFPVMRKPKAILDVKRRLNFKAGIVLASIIESKQFTSTDSVNEIDFLNQFQYIFSLHSKHFATDKRRFLREYMGVFDPLNTSLSNIGVSGGMCPSIDSKFFKVYGKKD
ncbi:MAG: hypothetical protein ACRC92_02290 [Peptostreptococcaceae bacterium]